MCVLERRLGFSLSRAPTVITTLKQDSRTMFANIRSHKKLLIHFDIIFDPFPGRFIGESSFVYVKQKFAKYSGSACLNVCFRNDICLNFSFISTPFSQPHRNEKQYCVIHTSSQAVTCKRQIPKVKDKEMHKRSKPMYGELLKRGATFSNKPSRE